MKHNYLTLLLAMLMSMVSNVVSAHSFGVNGIYYLITSHNSKVAVSCKGALYSSNSNEYKGNVTIPETVTYDGITYRVTSINGDAFRECTGLTSVNIPESVTSIGYNAFDGCSSLTSITIPNSVTDIGGSAFHNCTGLTSITIPESVTMIGGNAFNGCSSLTSITIPNGVTKIGIYTFQGCSGLTSVIIGNSVTSIGQQAFYKCSSLTSVIIGNSVTDIGKAVFASCSGLTSVTIPNSVISIEESAFGDCTGLTSVTIGNSVTKIGSGAFYCCSGLTSIAIPNSVTSIGGEAFYGCSNLNSVTIGNSVTSIGNRAFKECSTLKDVFLLTETCPQLGTSVFPKNISLYVLDPNKYKNLTDVVVKQITIPETKAEVEYCGTIPTLDFECTEDFSVESYDTILLTKDVGTYQIPVTLVFHGIDVPTQATVNITKKGLTVKANDLTKNYGEENPELTISYVGFVSGEDSEVLQTQPQANTTADKTSSVGDYDITVSGATASNYEISFQNGKLTIEKAPLSLCANNKTRLYYEENPELTYTCRGFMNSDNISVFTTQPVLECSATMLSDAGTYPITIRGAQCKNYALSYEDSLLTINKRTLEIIPDNAQRKYGEENPRFTYSLQGFVSNQNKSVIDEMPEIYTTATKSSDVGTYEICSRGGEAKNYDFNYDKKGTLTINKAEQTIIWEQDLSKIKIGDQVELLAYATSGLEVEYLVNTDVDGISVYTSGGKNYLDCYSKGSYYVRATQAGNKNYEAALRVSKNVVVGDETAIGDITENESDCKVYDIKGNRLSKPQRGINIVRMKDGTSRKVLIR